MDIIDDAIDMTDTSSVPTADLPMATSVQSFSPARDEVKMPRSVMITRQQNAAKAAKIAAEKAMATKIASKASGDAKNKNIKASKLAAAAAAATASSPISDAILSPSASSMAYMKPNLSSMLAKQTMLTRLRDCLPLHDDDNDNNSAAASSGVDVATDDVDAIFAARYADYDSIDLPSILPSSARSSATSSSSRVPTSPSKQRHGRDKGIKPLAHSDLKLAWKTGTSLNSRKVKPISTISKLITKPKNRMTASVVRDSASGNESDDGEGDEMEEEEDGPEDDDDQKEMKDDSGDDYDDDDDDDGVAPLISSSSSNSLHRRGHVPPPISLTGSGRSSTPPRHPAPPPLPASSAPGTDSGTAYVVGGLVDARWCDLFTGMMHWKGCRILAVDATHIQVEVLDANDVDLKTGNKRKMRVEFNNSVALAQYKLRSTDPSSYLVGYRG